MATTKKPTKPELTAAFDSGVDARKGWHDGQPVPECEYPDGPLLTAWSYGWRGQDDLEKTQLNEAMDERLPTESELAAERQETTDAVLGVQQLEEHGHNVTDPEVAEHREELAGLMTAFDNIGVQITEENWRDISDSERSVAAKWANDMRIGEVRPCPEFLLQYATEALKAASAKHHEVQKEMQSTLFPVEFKKPSRSKLDENGEYKVTVNMKVDRDRVRLTRAEELWGWVRNRIEFGSIPCSEWQPQLPGMDNPKVITCEADVIKFGWTKGGYTFGFRVGQDTLSIEDAMALWDGEKGSCRMTPLGDPEPEPEIEQEESTAALIAKSRPLPSGPSLFDEKKDSNDDADVPYEQQHSPDGEFFSPAEYVVPSHVPGTQTIISVGNKGGKYFGSVAVVFFDEDQVEHEEDWGNPQLSEDGSASLTLAVQKEIGTAIDYLMEKNATAKCLKDLRDELKRLEDGGEPIPMPEE